MNKPYHEMSVAERLASRISANRAIENKLQHGRTRWSLDEIVIQLNAKKQRATYGAVAKIVGGLARGLMNGRAKSPEYSWVVASDGSQRGWPTGYEEKQIHSDCLRQIRSGQDNVINDENTLRKWLEHQH